MGSMLRITALCAGLLFLCLSGAILFPHTVGAVGDDADQQCIPAIPPCPCGTIMGSKGCIPGANKYLCPCFDNTSGFITSGICQATAKCLGTATGGMAPMLPMIPMPMPKMGMMMMPDPCASGTGSSSPCGTGGFENFGSSMFDASAYTNVDSSSNASDLFGALDSSGGGVSTVLNNATATAAPPQSPAPTVPTTTGKLIGAIHIGEAGATLVANLRDSVSEVAGFFGGNAFGVIGGTSIAGRLCATRPWAGSIITKIIPVDFFDGLCRFTGFQVGVAVPAVVNSSAPIRNAPPPKPTIHLPTPTGVPEVDIWAEPPRVRLGSRTYIFWNAKGVLDCSVTGPNFFHNTFSGGASTVPVSGATTYSIECTAPDGTKVTKNVTVDLAI